ncbi:MAG: hypothetical protein AABZ12_14235 [Planctomycetota bacterium]
MNETHDPNAVVGAPTGRELLHPSRRAFLRGAAVKGVYLAPVVLAISASSARAGTQFMSWCGDAGSPCTVDGDCCTGLTCVSMMCA